MWRYETKDANMLYYSCAVVGREDREVDVDLQKAICDHATPSAEK